MVNERSARPGSRLHAAIWTGSTEAMPRWKGLVIGPLRFVLVMARDLTDGQITLRAMGLVYTTLLSLVPLLALSFSVLKAFGVYNQIEPLLQGFLAPLGARSREVSAWIIRFIENLNIGVLGSIGLVLLIYTAVSLMQKIEESFNFIWHVGRLRSFGRRFSGYLSVLLVGPVLAFATLGISSAITGTAVVRHVLEAQPIGGLAHASGQAIRVILVIAGFTFAYAMVPNTRVRFEAAFTGGAIAGTIWQLASWTFAAFVARSTQYAAIYSTFAILVLVLIWLYLNWLIVLLGASISFYRQYPQYLIAESGEPRLSNRMRERVALMAMLRVGRSYLEGGPPCTFDDLLRRLGVPMHALEHLLGAMEKAGLLTQTADEPPAYVPARDMGSITLQQMLDAVRAAGEDQFLGPQNLPAPAELEEVLRAVDLAAAERLAGRNLRDLVTAERATPGAIPPSP